MAYKLSGSILEVCDCAVLCPCWIGEDPDNGTCQSAIAYRIDEGHIDGLDVSGLNYAAAVFIPGNVLAGNWRGVFFIDERATAAQAEALRSVFRGERGGPLADLARLTGDVVAIERARISFDVVQGRGTLRIGNVVAAELEPYRGPTGAPTQLVDSIFSTIPGSPAYVGKAQQFRMTLPSIGVDLAIEGRNAIQGFFAFEG